MMRNLPLLHIGCAGWSIASVHAKHFSYEGTHLERYALVFNAVEINSSFYRPHKPQTYLKWADATPEDFRFSVKMPKTISHQKRLRDCDDELDAFLDQTAKLGKKLGVLLLQLPPSLAFDAKVALPFFDSLREKTDVNIACEPRHASWFNAPVDVALRDRHIARVAADPARTARAAIPAGDHTIEYLRLHGSPRMYYDAYSSEALERIAKRLSRRSERTRERWSIFDNTAQGHAISNALALKAMIET